MIKSASRSSITNDQKYRSMLAGSVPSNEYLISTTVLTQNEPSITFDVSSFAGVYRHLQIVAVGRTSGGIIGNAEGDAVRIRFNGDAGNNYNINQLYADGSNVISTSSGSVTAMGAQRFADSTGTANAFGAFITDILDCYSTTKNKTLKSFGGTANQIALVSLNNGLWRSTAAVNSITLLPNVGANFNPGTRFSVYGVTA